MRSIASAVVFGLVIGTVLPANVARADATKCRAGIAKASAAFVQSRGKALRACADAVVRGRLPPATDCATNPPTASALAKAMAKLEGTIVKACAGRDKTCGTLDDDALASIGWGQGTCPDFLQAGCVNPIASCDDIDPCLACIGAAAVAQVIDVSYGALQSTDPKA